jgi:hypothetical protein
MAKRVGSCLKHAHETGNLKETGVPNLTFVRHLHVKCKPRKRGYAICVWLPALLILYFVFNIALLSQRSHLKTAHFAQFCTRIMYIVIGN